MVVTPKPDRLAFVVQPSNTEDEGAIDPPVSVAVVDEGGDVIAESGVVIHLELLRSNGGPHDFEGQATQVTVDGIAVFPGLRVDHDHDDFRFRATAPDRPELGSVESETFEIED